MNFISNLKVFAHGTFPKLYGRLEQWDTKRKKHGKMEHFQSHVNEVFADFDAAMKESGTDYWLTFGTLLGAIREHGIISHDNDLDVGVFVTADFARMETAFARRGIVKTRQIDIYSRRGEGGSVITYGRDGVWIDLFAGVLNEEDDTVTLNDFWDSRVGDGFRLYTKARAVRMPFGGLMGYEFLGCQVKVPVRYHECLSIHYGENYMTPDPTWTAAAPPDTTVLEDAVGIRFL